MTLQPLSLYDSLQKKTRRSDADLDAYRWADNKTWLNLARLHIVKLSFLRILSICKYLHNDINDVQISASLLSLENAENRCQRVVGSVSVSSAFSCWVLYIFKAHPQAVTVVVYSTGSCYILTKHQFKFSRIVEGKCLTLQCCFQTDYLIFRFFGFPAAFLLRVLISNSLYLKDVVHNISTDKAVADRHCVLYPRVRSQTPAQASRCHRAHTHTHT